MRMERIVCPQDIAHEVATYNELIPRRGEFCASLLIENVTRIFVELLERE